MTARFILHDMPYGTERSYNGLRLALAVVKVDDVEIRMFLIGDAVGCARLGPNTQDGQYNIGWMLKG